MRRHIFLLKELIRRDFQGRYAGSMLGFAWSFIQPLWLLLLFSFVFATVMKIPLLGQRTENFGVFLFAGLLPWMALQEGIQRGSTAITDNATLVRKLSFPSEILVLTAVLGALLHEAIALGLFAVVLLVIGELAVTSLPWLLVVVPLQVSLALGLGLLLASLNVFFRDIAQLLGMLLTGWFYFTPIVYPLGLVPEGYRGLVAANPLTPVVELYRQALLGGGGGFPEGFVALVLTATSALALGLLTFRRLKTTFVDEI